MILRQGRKRKIAAIMDDMIQENDAKAFVDGSSGIEHQTTMPTVDGHHASAPAVGPAGRLEEDCTVCNLPFTVLVTIGQVMNLIPPVFLEYRLQYIASIMNEVNENEPLSTATISSAMHHLQKLNGLKNLGHPPRDMLWKVTFKRNLPYMEFIGPPVLDCVTCKQQLQSHNPPTPVVCFGLEGPLPGLKITLRCRNCCLNYRYTIHIT